MMRFWVISGIAAGTLLALASVAPSAQAQSRNYQRGTDATVVYYTDEFGRRRTRVILQKRSYLDAGTEVLPGERKFNDYAQPPGYSAIDSAMGPGHGYDRQPLNGFYDVRNNPRY
jgi:hypothetical protein